MLKRRPEGGSAPWGPGARAARRARRLAALLAAFLLVAGCSSSPSAPQNLGLQNEIAVVSFTLIDADRNRPVSGFDPVPAGAQIILADLPTKNLNLRANTSPATVGSVVFGLNSEANVQTENAAPYALFSDRQGDYYAWTPPAGQYSVTATPYPRSGGRGSAGRALRLDFTVLEKSPAAGSAVISLTLIDADRNRPIAGFNPIPDGATLDLATLPTKNLNIRANTSPVTVGSVRFALNDNPDFQTENAAPYALASDRQGDYFAWTPPVGEHRVTATPYSRSGARGTAGEALSLRFRVVDGSAAPLRAALVTGGLTRPTSIKHAGDGSGRLFVTLRGGQIRIIENGRLLSQPFLDIGHLVSHGLMDVAFHPEYKNNRYFYVNYVDKNHNTVVARYRTRSGNPNAANPDSAKLILTVDETTSDHYGGQTKFGPDGYLYIALGDGGPQGDPRNHAQNRSNLLGAMLRIDVGGGDPYAVPPNNPFVKTAGARGEIWAYGLRNPWRFSFDRATGDLFIADVGYDHREEINFQPAESQGGENYGWRRMEGSRCFNPSTGCNDGSLSLPVLEYDTGENCSVTGGYRYRGSELPDLYGVYVYGDFCSGRVWGGVPGARGRWTSTELLHTGTRLVTFGESETGELYFADFAGGAVYRLTR